MEHQLLSGHLFVIKKVQREKGLAVQNVILYLLSGLDYGEADVSSRVPMHAVLKTL